MKYFVIGPDGSKYGPADLDTLNKWAREGRILATTVLEEEAGGRRLNATDVLGLNIGVGGQTTPGMPPQHSPGPEQQPQNPFAQQPQQPQQPQSPWSQPNQTQSPWNQPTQSGWSQPPGPGGYYRDPRSYDPNAGNTEVVWAWVLGAIGLLCCPIVFSTTGIVLANNAKQKGHPSASAAMIFCIISLVAGIAMGVLFAAMGGWGRMGRY